MNQQAKSKNKSSNGKHIQSSYRTSLTQAAALIASTMIGVGVLTLPRSTTDAAHQFGWLSVLFAFLFCIAALFTIYKLGARFPDRTLVGICEQVLGSSRRPWVGRVLSFPIVFAYFCYWWLVMAIVARTFGEVVVTAVLVRTPLEVIVGTMLALCLVLAMYEEEVVARVNEVLLLLIVVPILFIAISAYQNARIEYILPLIPPAKHYMGVISGVMPALTSFLGFETLLMFNHTLVREKHLFRAQFYGLLIPGILYLLIVIAGIMSFGYEELSEQVWPTLELIKSVNVPGLILERMEAVFLGVWVAAVFTTAGNWFYCATRTFSEQFRIRKEKWTAIVLVIAAYYAAMWPKNINELFKILEWIGYAGVVAAFGVPLLLLLLAKVRRLDESDQAQGKEEERHEAEAG